VFKLIMLIKKRPDLTREQFIDYYDNHHIHLMHRILPLGAAVHRRNFVVPNAAGSANAAGDNSDYDAIVEVFYESREAAMNTVQALNDPQIKRQMEEDEQKFILRSSLRRYVVEAHQTVFRPMPGVDL
jgi:hypothetical protein